MKRKMILAMVLIMSVSLTGCGSAAGNSGGYVSGAEETVSGEVELNIPQEVLDINRTLPLLASHWDMEEVQNCIDEDGVLTVPMVISDGIKHRIESVGENFYNRYLNDGLIEDRGYGWFDIDSVKKIVIPDTVTSISDYAFVGLPNLEEVVLPAGLEEMSDCFFDCPKLKKVTLPKSLKTIGENVFTNCESLEEVVWDANTTRIQGNAFEGTPWMNKQLSEAKDGWVIVGDQLLACTSQDAVVTLPVDIGYVAGAAFRRVEQSINELIIKDLSVKFGNGALTTDCIRKVTFDCEAEELPYSILGGCSGMKEVVLPRNLKRIIKSAFIDCSALETIDFPESLEAIGKTAFAGCSSLQSIDLPASVYWIDSYAFSECSALKEVSYAESCGFGQGVFKNCISLENALWSSNPDTNYYDMYSGCTGLKEVVIPEHITVLKNYMFNDCTNLETVVLHEGITEIGVCTFGDCVKLDVTIPDSCYILQSNSFENVKHISYNGSHEEAPFGAESMN